MGFIFATDEDERSQLVLSEEPAFVISLPTAPAAMEQCQRQGIWLVVSMSLWSGHDLSAGRRAIQWAQRHSGDIRLALRLYDYPEEFSTWLPQALGSSGAQTTISVTEQAGQRHVLIQQNPGSSPVRAILREGILDSIAFGRLIDEEIEDFVQASR